MKKGLNWAIGLVLAFMVGTALAAITQRPLDPRTGKSAGIGYGTTLPSDPHSDEVYVLTSATTNPYPHIYDSTAGAWRTILTVAGQSQGVPAANGSTTDNYIPVWNNTSSEFENSVISDSGTLATLDTDADLLFPDSVQAQFGTGGDVDIYWDNARTGLVIDGSASSPARTIFIEGGNGAGSTIATIGNGTQASMTFTNAVGNGSSINYVNITPDQDTMGGGNPTQNALQITMESKNHSGGTMQGLNINSITPDVNSFEHAINVETGWDAAIHLEGSNMQFHYTDSMIFSETIATTAQIIISDVNDAGGSMDFLELAFTPAQMDGAGDHVAGITIDIAQAVHTGGDWLAALYIDSYSGSPIIDTERAIFIQDGYDEEIYFGGGAIIKGASNINLVAGTSVSMVIGNGNSVIINDASGYDWTYNDEDGVQQDFGATLAVVGAAQTVSPSNNFVRIGAAAGASVTTITVPGLAGGQILHFVCDDANVTFNDSDAAGAAGTINTAGAATNFVCSAEDTITFLYVGSPLAGNARWMEVARSVN